MKRKGKIWFSILLLALYGCRTVPTGVVADEQHVRTNVVESIVRDSIFLRDSVFLQVKADTVYYTKYRTLYKEKIIRDTITVCDTLYRERVVTMESRALPPVKHRLMMLLLLAVVVLWLSKRCFKV